MPEALTRRTGARHPLRNLPESLQQIATRERFHLYDVPEFQDASWGRGFDSRYFPQNCDVITLPCFWVERGRLYLYSSQPNVTDDLPSYFLDGSAGRVLFPVHPLSLPSYECFVHSVHAEPCKSPKMLAVPTSSVRTLLAWPADAPERAIFVKTSLGPDRCLHARKIAYCVGITKLIKVALPELPMGLAYLSEPFGLVTRGPPNSGAILRPIPQRFVEGTASFAPLLSFIGGDADHPPLLLTMIRDDKPRADEFLETLCNKLASIWLETVMHCGLIPEFHAQNLLAVLAADGRPTGEFLYRDFNGLMVDWELRRALGLPIPNDMPHAWSWDSVYGSLEPGTPYVASVWWKWWMSLHAYLHFVLHKFNCRLLEWQAQKLIVRSHWKPEQLTIAFTANLVAAIHRTFGLRIAAQANIYASINEFLLSLLKMRKEVLSARVLV